MTRSFSKRKFVEIRNLIIESLKKYPKNTDQVSKDLKISHRTAKNHLEFLQTIGILRKTIFNLKNGKIELWELAKFR